MIYPTDTEQALYAMTLERNALAAECERLVDALGKERQASADAREMLMGMGHALADAKREADAKLERDARCLQSLLDSKTADLSIAMGLLKESADAAVKFKAESDASRKLMVDALTAVVPGSLTEAIVDIARGRDVERVAAEKERDALRKAVGVTVMPAHAGGLT